MRHELAGLPQQLQHQVPYFETVLQLPENGDFRDEGLGAAMESALLVVLQVGMLIGDYESRDAELSLDPDHTVLAGLSIGLFAAAAVAVARSLSDVVKTGAESLRVAFRLGVYVEQLSHKLDAAATSGLAGGPTASSGNRGRSWAHVVTGLPVDTIREALAAAQGDNDDTDTTTSTLTKVFVSAADKTSVSVSGPPSRLRAVLQQSATLRYAQSFALPVYDGLCHAPHLYGPADVEAVVGGLRPEMTTTTGAWHRPVRLALLSSSSGRPFAAETCGKLLTAITTELMTGAIFLDKIAATVLERVVVPAAATTAATTPAVHVDSFRTSLSLRGIVNAMADACATADMVAVHDLVDWATTARPQAPTAPSLHLADSKLAIVGMSCRMPGGANDLDEFWSRLAAGYDAHTTVPPDRFDLATHFDPTGATENAAQTPFGNFVDRPGFFDAAFFSMSPREARETDPMQRLALVAAYEALERAGVVPGRTPSTRRERIGTFLGQASDDWRELNASQNIGTYAVPGGERALGPGRINYVFGFGGPALSIDTACSSSMAAVHAACSALWAGAVDTAVAGGLNIITDPDNYAGLGNAFFLSPTGQCRVWDATADGYCRGDGIGAVVIKRLADAEADNDHVLAVVLAAATNHSADAVSITHPHAGAQKDNYRAVLQHAGVSPLDVSYVELHGTGTQAGDATESESVLDVLAPSPTTTAGRQTRRPDQHLYLGAVKANIGHGGAAAGVTSLIKALLCFEHSLLPPHVVIRTAINPAIPRDLDRRHAGLAMELTAWARPVDRSTGQPGKRLAMVNSFGAHGGNTTVLLEDGPVRRRSADGLVARRVHPFCLSAKSKKSLEANVRRLLAYLDEHPDADSALADLSYTLCARRMHHPLRLATTASSAAGLRTFLQRALDAGVPSTTTPVPSEPPAVVFAFTGQGTPGTGGIGQELFDDAPVFRAEVLQLDRLVQRLGFGSVVPAITGEGVPAGEAPPSPVTSQLATVVVELALWRLWTHLGIQPGVVVGHSLGEYAALAVAGVLSVVDVLHLVGRRAQLTQERCAADSHAMLAVQAAPDAIDALLRQDPASAASACAVTCYNTPADTVLGGPGSDVAAAQRVLERHGVKCVRLAGLPFAFHTAQMDPVLDGLEALARPLAFAAPAVPLVSSLLGRAVFDGKTVDSAYLRRHTREPVRFADAVAAAAALAGPSAVWLECGPHPLCVSFAHKVLTAAGPPTCVASLRRGEDNLTTLARSLVALHLAGATPAWHEHFAPHEHSAHTLLADLPHYGWNETDYWIPYYGTWTLDKARLRDGGSLLQQPAAVHAHPGIEHGHGLYGSLFHDILVETVDPAAGTAVLHVLSDLQQHDLLAAVRGHRMNGHSVATSSIWTAMAYDVGDYLYGRVAGHETRAFADVFLEVRDLEVLHAQVAAPSSSTPQRVQLEAHLDLGRAARHMTLAWYNVASASSERAADPFATAAVDFVLPASAHTPPWLAEWARVAHLVRSRIAALDQLAVSGAASTLTKNMAYTLFQNVVDYADHYRGIDRVVLLGYEAAADVTLPADHHGTYRLFPPHWIDAVCHLAGLVLNGSDASNTADYFYVTPGSDNFRLARPLQPGGVYRAYVHMFALPLESGTLQMYAGDVYILQGDSVVGVLTQIRFRRVPRLLMDRFFSPPKAETETEKKPKPAAKAVPVPVETPRPAATNATNAIKAAKAAKAATAVLPPAPMATPAPSPPPTPPTALSAQCLHLIAAETSLALDDLKPDALFAQLGIDSLMSLVLSEKFRSELRIDIKSSLFLECPTIGEMTAWIDQNC